MEFKLTVNMDNAAFGNTTGDNADELARILREVAAKMPSHAAPDGGRVRDQNGNVVGAWELIS